MTSDDDPDAVLVERALKGDRGAFTILARRHGPPMARTARALGVPTSEVEDVVQGALIAAWRSLVDYDPARPFSAWACVIAANKARDWRRHFRVRRLWLQAEPLERQEALNVEDPWGSPNFEDRDRLRRVARALEQLPEHLKVPLVLISAGGLTQGEAALALGVSQKTIETRIARARGRLTKLLASGP